MIPQAPRWIACLFGSLLLLTGPIRAQVITDTTRFLVRVAQEDGVVERTSLAPSSIPVTRVRLRSAEAVGLPTNPGVPQLPFLIRQIGLPESSAVLGIRIDTGQSVSVGDVQVVEWAQLAQPGQSVLGRDPVPPTGPGGEPDFVYYSSPENIPPDPSILQLPVWPEKAVRLVGTSHVAGYQVLTFQVFPVQWEIGSGVLDIHPTIAVSIEYTSATIRPPPTPIPATTSPWGTTRLRRLSPSTSAP